MSLLPYEDPSASFQRQLKAQRRQEAVISEAADETDAEAEAGQEPSGPAAAAVHTTEDTTPPPSGSQKKD